MKGSFPSKKGFDGKKILLFNLFAIFSWKSPFFFIVNRLGLIMTLMTVLLLNTSCYFAQVPFQKATLHKCVRSRPTHSPLVHSSSKGPLLTSKRLFHRFS